MVNLCAGLLLIKSVERQSDHMKKIILILSLLIVSGLLSTACSAGNQTASANTSVSSSEAPVSSTVPESTQTSVSSSEGTQSADTSTIQETAVSDSEKDIARKTKDYLLNGQQDKPEADKLKWSEAFLNQVNIGAVYQKYLSGGGKADDIQSFARYLTQNAPVPDNWQELFAEDLLKKYEVKVVRYVPVQNNLYQVYVKISGKEVPYVAVNARTGYFHG